MKKIISLTFISLVLSLVPALESDAQDAFDHSAVERVAARLASGDLSLRRAEKEIARMPVPQKSVSSPSEFASIKDPDTIYMISGDIDLGGKTVKIPAGCVIFVRRGVLSNGKITGNGTLVIADNRKIFEPGETKYRGYKKKSDYSYSVSRKGSLELSGTWANETVASKWTGLESANPDKCQSLALNNMVCLYRKDTDAIIPSGRYYIYDWLRLGGRTVDFSGSELLSIDFGKVEDLSIKLPDGVTESPLRSRYGLLDLSGNGSYVCNVTIDGRASSRDEEPKLGCECLIAIGSISGGTLKNVTLKDAVDCAICTGAISGYTFENLVIDGCGEHGIYTHAYQDTLWFKNCVFNNCSQSPSLFKARGISGCVRCASSRERKYTEITGFRVFFENCKFSGDGEYKAATLYSDIPFAEFRGCKWSGKISGYVFNTTDFSEQTGLMCEYDFYDCDNPCGNHNAINVRRKLVRCTNVRNAFEDTYLVEDCDIIAVKSEVRNMYKGSFAGEIKNPVTFRRCNFRSASSKPSGRATMAKARPMVFEDCKFSLAGGGLLGVENADFTFRRCSGIPNYNAVLNGNGKKNKVKVVKD